jgi:hypothetical protein
MEWASEAAQVLMYRACGLPGMLFGIRRRDMCRFRYETMLNVWFDRPLVYLESLPHDKPLCFRRVIAGHASAYSLKYQFPRGGYIRRFRDNSVRRARLLLAQGRAGGEGLEGGGREEGGKGEKGGGGGGGVKRHHVIVMCKSSQHALTQPRWRNGCFQTKTALAAIDTGLTSSVMTCPDFISSSLQQQIEMVVQATVVVTEHGTTSYTSIFARHGTAVLVIGQAPLKEAQILLQATHIQVMYVSTDRLDQEYSDDCATPQDSHAPSGEDGGERERGGGGGRHGQEQCTGRTQGGELRGLLLHALNRAARGFNLLRARLSHT